jgi:hypothetical protein
MDPTSAAKLVSALDQGFFSTPNTADANENLHARSRHQTPMGRTGPRYDLDYSATESAAE